MPQRFYQMISWQPRSASTKSASRMQPLEAAFLMMIASGVVRTAEADPPRLPTTSL